MRTQNYGPIQVSRELIDWLIDYVGWDWRLRTAAITGLLFIPRVNASVGAVMTMIMPAGDNSRLVYQSSLAVLPAKTSGEIRRNYEGMIISHIQYLWYVNGSFTCRKILRRSTSGFTSHPKQGVLRIFIALKNPSPRPGLNPRPLSPVASTLITTPPRRPRASSWLSSAKSSVRMPWYDLEIKHRPHVTHLSRQIMFGAMQPLKFKDVILGGGSLFYDAHSVTRIYAYSVDDRATSKWRRRIDEDKHPFL
jgi:hypothetical protein